MASPLAMIIYGQINDGTIKTLNTRSGLATVFYFNPSLHPMCLSASITQNTLVYLFKALLSFSLNTKETQVSGSKVS
jgi:hypothetical protein